MLRCRDCTYMKMSFLEKLFRHTELAQCYHPKHTMVDKDTSDAFCSIERNRGTCGEAGKLYKSKEGN